MSHYYIKGVAWYMIGFFVACMCAVTPTAAAGCLSKSYVPFVSIDEAGVEQRVDVFVDGLWAF